MKIIIIYPFLFSGCLATGISPEISSPVPILLKYPLVLAHGIAIHDRGKTVRSWGRIPDLLKEKGIDVFFGYTDAWGDFDTNAELLKTGIDKILNDTKKEKVNIIAHSKGGIDSRYMIWKYDYGDKIASLTTISTPHHGAELSDLLCSKKGLHTKTTKSFFRFAGKMFRDNNPDIYTSNYQLTTEYMKEFNEKVTWDKRVYYQTIYSTMNKPSDDVLLSGTYRYLKKTAGANDGLVSEWSARWGDNILKVEGGISHAYIIDYNKRKRLSSTIIPDLYLGIVNELSKKGF